MIKKTIWILLAVSALAFVLGSSTVRADERNKPSVQLADASKALVPAIAIDATSLTLTDLETVPPVTAPPADRDPAITAVIQTRSLPNVAARVPAPGTSGVMRRPVR